MTATYKIRAEDFVPAICVLSWMFDSGKLEAIPPQWDHACYSDKYDGIVIYFQAQ